MMTRKYRFLNDRTQLCNALVFATPRGLKPAARFFCRIAHGHLVFLLSLAGAAYPGFATASGPLDPDDPPQGRFADDWAEVYMAGGKVGYMHSTMAREDDLIRTEMEMLFEMARADQRIQVNMSQYTTETLLGLPASFGSIMDASVMKTGIEARPIRRSQAFNARTFSMNSPSGGLACT